MALAVLAATRRTQPDINIAYSSSSHHVTAMRCGSRKRDPTAAIAALPAPFRETLVLRDIEGLDYREIAQATEVPIGTVMSRLARARGRLTATLGTMP